MGGTELEQRDLAAHDVYRWIARLENRGTARSHERLTFGGLVLRSQNLESDQNSVYVNQK